MLSLSRITTASLAIALILLSATPGGVARDPIICTPNGSYVQPAKAPAPVKRATGLGMDVWEGATPPGLDPSLPVLVFVHGLHGSANGWFGDTMYAGINDFYDHAYEHGYKTFMVDLWDAREIPNPAEDGIENGRLLRDQIQWITGYWGVPEVNVVAHSKGGVDSNVAALLGAPIDTIVTLSGAHRGSPLADLAQSDLWPDWLLELIGYNDDGTKFMQTGCMDLVRGIADGMAGNELFHIYTFAGTDWGPDFSALALAGAYLGTPLIGACPSGGPFDLGVRDNDGVVCVQHANHPWGRDENGAKAGSHRIVWDDQTGHGDWELDHDNMRTGAPRPEDDGSCHVETFEAVEKYAGSFHVAGPVGERPAHLEAVVPAVEIPARRALGHLFRGGELGAGGSAETAFPVEDGVRRLHIGALATSADLGVEIVSPTGRRMTLPAGRRGGGLLGAAYASHRWIRDPEPGQWRARLSGAEPAAWGLVVGLVATPPVNLEHAAAGAGIVDLAVDSVGRDVVAEVSVRETSVGRSNSRLDQRAIAATGGRLELPGSGVYNVRVSVRGITEAGFPYERSGVFTVAGGEGRGRRLPEACR